MQGCASSKEQIIILPDLNDNSNDFAQVMPLNPTYPVSHFNQGIEKDNKGDLEGAIADYSEAIRLKPDYPLAYLNRGIARGRKGDLGGAIADYSEAIRLKPDHSTAYFSRGIARGKKGDLDGAIADYSEAIHLQPDNFSAYLNRAGARDDRGDKEGAIADYSAAIQLRPEYSTAYLRRGIAKDNRGDLDGAIEDYSDTIRLKPDDFAVYISRGIAKGVKGDLEGAIEDYSAAIVHNPEDINALLTRGNYYERNLNYDSAISDYKKVLELDPANVYAKKSINSLLYILNGNVDFIKRYQKMLSRLKYYHGKADGVSGSVTRAAVNRFQKDNRLKPIGEVDSETLEILVEKYNNAGEVYNATLETLVRPSITGTPRPGNKYAVIIGIEKYDDGNIPRLDYAVNDAEGFAETLIDKGKFLPRNILLLTDSSRKAMSGIKRLKPSYENMKSALFTKMRSLALRREDTVVIFYSGYGAVFSDAASPNGKASYLAPDDFEINSPAEKGIRLEELRRLTYLPPDRMVFILGSCFTGSDDLYASPARIPKHKIKPGPTSITGGFATGPGKVLMAAGLDSQISFDSDDLQKSLFAHFLIEIINTGERSVSKIFDHVYAKVKEVTQGRQEPRLDTIKQQGTIYLY